MYPPHGHPTHDVVQLPQTQPVWIVSDLHLGDGTPSDVFFGKDDHLLALIDRVVEHNAILVVNGDVIDLHQAWTLERILRAHARLLSVLGELAHQGRLIYVVGNHDVDLGLFRDILRFRIADEVHLGDAVRIHHGHQYDPYIQHMLAHGQWHTRVHHLAERILGTWLRIPLREFYTLPNRLMFWLAHKAAIAARSAISVAHQFDLDVPSAHELLANLNFWSWSNEGDSMGIFRPAVHDLQTGPWRAIVCGHSHLPGVVNFGDRVYANSGSWTFASSTYIKWDGTDLTCTDWLTDRHYGAELYAPMLDGTLYERDFLQWWRENYMGWLRYRQGEARQGQLRGWQAMTLDRARLGQREHDPIEPPAKPVLHVISNDPPPQRRGA